MQRDPVVSSVLASVGYEPATETLEIRFLTGAVYRYANVPVTVHRELMEAGSKGRYFNRHIRPTYPYLLVGEWTSYRRPPRRATRRTGTGSRRARTLDAPVLAGSAAVAPGVWRILTGRALGLRLWQPTARGDLVRTREDVIFANLLHAAGVEYDYERPLLDEDGTRRYPAFTVETPAGAGVVYWEHLGRRSDRAAAHRWREKLKWYRVRGLEPNGPANSLGERLVTSRNRPDGTIGSARLRRKLHAVFDVWPHCGPVSVGRQPGRVTFRRRTPSAEAAGGFVGTRRESTGA